MPTRTTEANKFGSTDEAATPKKAVKATAESGALIAANPGRVSVYVQNTDATKAAWLAFGAAAVKAEGIKLPAKMEQPWRIADYTGAINVIADEGEPVIGVLEV